MSYRGDSAVTLWLCFWFVVVPLYRSVSFTEKDKSTLEDS